MRYGKASWNARSGWFRTLLMAGTAFAPAIASDVAMAQNERPMQAGTDAGVHTLSIPPQNLASALVAFSRQTRVQIVIDQALASGKSSPGVSGALAPAAALSRLLAGTGLTYRFTNATSVSVERPGAAASGGTMPAGAIALDTIDVQGEPSSDPGRTEGTGSYTPSVTATATRFQLTPRETPQSISVITQQQMNDFSLRSINDVVNQTPGLSVQNAGAGITNYYARGFTIQSMQYDGMQTYLNGTYPGTDTSRDMAMYDRVEVLKGTSGLTTGAGNPGATINLIRKKPTRAFQGYTTLRAGSWDDYRGELDLSGALNESGTVRGRFVTAHQDSRSYLSHREQKSSLFYGIVEADLTPDTLLTIGADYQRYVPGAIRLE